MALLFADGFDCYANSTQWIESNWGRIASGVVEFNATEGRFGGGCIKGTTNAYARCGVYVPIGGTIIIGWSYKHDGLGTAADGLVSGRDRFDASQMFRLEHNASGDLKVFNQPNAQIGSTVTGALAANTWYWIEVKVVLGTTDSNGSITINVDGTQIFTATSIDTYSAGEELLSVYFGGGDGLHWIDDVVIMDATGANMNDFIGPTRIDTFIPNAAGGVTNWTPNTGTQVQCVDDTIGAADDDTTYIDSNTATQEARFEVGNLTVAPNAIHGLQVRARYKKANAGPRTVRSLVNVASVEATGPTVGAPTDYAWSRLGFFRNNPNTSAPFTANQFNTAQIGVEIVA